MTDARRAAIVALLLLLAGGAALAVFPLDVASVWVSGVSALWWYTIAIAPAAALVIVIACRVPGGITALAAWAGPLTVVTITALVFAGDADAPALALAWMVAPFVASLWTRSSETPAPVVRGLVGFALALVLWANCLAMADLARVLGLSPWTGLVAACGLAVTLELGPVRPAWRRRAAPVGASALILVTVVLGLASGTAPWTAWARVASRPQLAFDQASAWVNGGAALLEPTTLVFTEPHRVTALNESLYRVVERNGGDVTVREWRLTSGDALTLRPGDELVLPKGARLRFEPGKRVPGAALSGVAWSAGQEHGRRRSLTLFVGLTITLLGGASVLVPTRATRAVVGGVATPVAIVAVALAAWCWAVYGAYAAPDLALGAPSIAPLVRLPKVLLPAPWGGLLAAVTVVALLVLFAAMAAEMRRRVTVIAGGRSVGLVAWLGVLCAATGAGAWALDPWRVFLMGLGFATAAVVAPELGALRASEPRRARLLGGLAGAAAFGGILTAGFVGSFPAVLLTYPALVAAPVAGGISYLAGGARR